VNPVLEPLAKTVRATHPKADIRLIERAYEVAARWHAGQKRLSGDPYITHPLAVATILAELGMNHETICAALLHDTVEDTAYTLVELRREFGDDVATLVDGVTKLDKVKYGEAAAAEAAQHAHPALPGAREAGAQVARGAGDLRAAGAPAGHEHREVGARGPGLRHAVPQALSRDRADGV
jgi:(p)ppGpp synthase/HD superfamily hydrolase